MKTKEKSQLDSLSPKEKRFIATCRRLNQSTREQLAGSEKTASKALVGNHGRFGQR